jgi:predicted peptidase
MVVGCGLLLAAPLCARRQETGFLNRIVTVDNGTYRYQVYVPRTWSNRVKWPVILFLHGYGGEGDDGLLQTQVGLATAIRSHVDRFPFLVVFPQCRKNDWWTAPKMEERALRALDQTVMEFKGDPQRIYLTGLSMGGYATWDLGARYPGNFAALVPVCGGILLPRSLAIPNGRDVDDSSNLYATVAQKIRKSPVWVFHGDAHQAVPVPEQLQEG